MAKVKKVLSVAEVFYINKMGEQGVPQEKIAEDLGVDIELVNINYPKVVKQTPVGQSMSRNRRYGTTVMTPTASQICDETKVAKVAGKSVECIHKPLGEVDG